MARIWKFKGPEGLPYSYEGDIAPTRDQLLEAYGLAKEVDLREEHLGGQTPITRWETEEGHERGQAAADAVAAVVTGGFGPDLSREEYDEAVTKGLIDPERAAGTPGAATGLVPQRLGPVGAPAVLEGRETPPMRSAEWRPEALSPAPDPRGRPGAVQVSASPYTGKVFGRGGDRGAWEQARGKAKGRVEARRTGMMYGIAAGTATTVGELLGAFAAAGDTPLSAEGMTPSAFGFGLTEEGGWERGRAVSRGEGVVYPPSETPLERILEKSAPTTKERLDGIEKRAASGVFELAGDDLSTIWGALGHLISPEANPADEPYGGEELLWGAFEKTKGVITPEAVVGDMVAMIKDPAGYAANYPLESMIVAASLLTPYAPAAARALLVQSEKVAGAMSKRWGRNAHLFGTGADSGTIAAALNDEILAALTADAAGAASTPLTLAGLLAKPAKGIVLDRRKKTYRSIKKWADDEGIEIHQSPPAGPLVAPQAKKALTRAEKSAVAAELAREGTRAPMQSELDDVLDNLGITDEPYAPKKVSDKKVYEDARAEFGGPAAGMVETNEQILVQMLAMAEGLHWSPRAISAKEVAGLNMAVKHLEAKMAKHADRFKGIDKEGSVPPSKLESKAYRTELNGLEKEMLLLVRAAQLSGSEVGRALRMYRVAIGRLFTPERLRIKAALNKGGPLSENQFREINTAADKIATAKKAMDERIEMVGAVQAEMDNIDARVAAITSDKPAGWSAEVRDLKKARLALERKRFSEMSLADDVGEDLHELLGRAEYLTTDAHIPWNLRAGEVLIQSALSLPRAFRATADLSAMLNQAAVGVFSRPLAGTLSAVEMVTALSKGGARRTVYGPRVGGDRFGLYGVSVMEGHKDRVAAGVRFLDLPGARANTMGEFEEFFARQGLDRLSNYPVIGGVAKQLMSGLAPFERAYGAMLNGMRARVWDDLAIHHVGLAGIPKALGGLFKEPTAEQKRQIALLVNITTGGGADLLPGSGPYLREFNKAMKSVGGKVFWSWNQTSSGARWVWETMPDALAISQLNFPAATPVKAGLRARKAYKAAKSARAEIQVTMDGISAATDPKVKARFESRLERQMEELRANFGSDIDLGDAPSKAAAKDAAGQMLIASEYARQVGSYLMILSMLKDQGYDIDLDIHSSRFGTITAADGYVSDLGGGKFQAMKMGVQALTARQRRPSGEITNYDEDYARSYSDPLLRFIRSKAHPTLGSAWDIVSGEDFIGREAGFFTTLGSLFVPLSVANILENIYEESGEGWRLRDASKSIPRSVYSIFGGRGFYEGEEGPAVGMIRGFLEEELGIDETEWTGKEMRTSIFEALDEEQ